MEIAILYFRGRIQISADSGEEAASGVFGRLLAGEVAIHVFELNQGHGVEFGLQLTHYNICFSSFSPVLFILENVAWYYDSLITCPDIRVI